MVAEEWKEPCDAHVELAMVLTIGDMTMNTYAAIRLRISGLPYWLCVFASCAKLFFRPNPTSLLRPNSCPLKRTTSLGPLNPRRDAGGPAVDSS